MDQYIGAKRITTKGLAARQLFQSAKAEQSDAGLFPYPAAHGVAPLNEPLELVSAETHALRPWSLAPQTWTGFALGGAILLFVAGGRRPPPGLYDVIR